MIQLDLLSELSLKIRTDNKCPSVFDIVRKQWVAFTPEEHVRQAILHYLVQKVQYPASLIAVEKQIKSGAMDKRYDIVVYNRQHKPWMLIECKAPDVTISKNTLYQLLHYQRIVNCSYWLISNGLYTFCADATNAEDIKWLEELPAYTL